jgi:coenzyme F420-reducing hydrogenase alpha subunit
VPEPPRKLICVVGEASEVPGSGETVTGLTAAAAKFASRTVVGGVPGPLDPQAPSVIAARLAAAAKHAAGGLRRW